MWDPATVAAARALCAEADYSVDGLTARLGDLAARALLRGDLLPARLALAGDESVLGRLGRAFLLGEPVSPDGLEPLTALGLLSDGRAALDLRPYGEWLVISDLGSEVTGTAVRPEHVLGVGSASLTLATATPRAPVERALDIGTGSGVQALHLSGHARRVTGTDSSPRALRLAALTLALNGLVGPNAELVEGDLLEPVAGREFDLVVANPPFVVGPPRQGFDYRDAGRGGDGVTEALVRGLPALLAPGGTAVILASWVHRRGADWRERVRDWLAGSGCHALVLQREVADPAEHTALWLADSGGAVSPEEYAGWLSYFDAERVDGIGTGVVALRRTEHQPRIELVEAGEPGVPVTGTEVADGLAALEWLAGQAPAGQALAGAVLVLGADVRLVQEAAVGADGWEVLTQQLHRGGRLTRTDPVGVELIGACDGQRSVGELLAVLGAAHGFDPAAGLPAVEYLVTRGLLKPAEEARVRNSAVE